MHYYKFYCNRRRCRTSVTRCIKFMADNTVFVLRGCTSFCREKFCWQISQFFRFDYHFLRDINFFNSFTVLLSKNRDGFEILKNIGLPETFSDSIDMFRKMDVIKKCILKCRDSQIVHFECYNCTFIPRGLTFLF